MPVSLQFRFRKPSLAGVQFGTTRMQWKGNYNTDHEMKRDLAFLNRGHTQLLLTQKLLHFLHTHVYVDTGVIVIVDARSAAWVGEAAGPFQQQDEEEASKSPQHRVWPTSGLKRAARAVNQPQHSSCILARSCSPWSPVADFFLSSVSEVNPRRRHY